MKKAILGIMAVMMLVGVLAKAEDKKSEYEIRTIQGQKIVMMPMELAKIIDQITKSDMPEATKLSKVQVMVAEMGKLSSSYDSFCKLSGDTYKTVNTDAHKMALQCEKRMQHKDMIHELVTEYKDLEELQYLYSITMFMQITFSM